jgi:hypothetical protein
VCLLETSRGFLLTYSAGWAGDGGRAQMFYDPPRIDELLSKGFKRRGTFAHTA